MSEIDYWRRRAEQAGKEVAEAATASPGSERHRLALAELHHCQAEVARHSAQVPQLDRRGDL